MDPVLKGDSELKSTIKEELFNGHEPDIIICTSGGIQKNQEGTWVPAYDQESDGGCLRTQAVASLASYFPNVPIVTSSGSVDYCEEKVADIYSKDLVRKGVDPQRILQMEKDRPSTFTEVISLCDLLSREDLKNVEEVMICTNTFHIPRFLAFLDVVINYDVRGNIRIFDNYAESRGINYLTPDLISKIKSIKERGVRFRVFSAEQAIDIVSPDSAYTIYGANKGENEKSGIGQLQNGTYFKPSR